jgi:AcrR family transcriptional regulator
MRVAASHGLAGLTIGGLARDLGISKSGLFAHFRSKQVLELTTISEARKVFTSQVLAPATAGNEGIERLWILCDSWLAHIERRVFPGGYFFTGAFFECAERSGAVEQEINAMAREWWSSLKSAVLKAQDRQEIDPAADARRVSFDLNGILMAAYWAFLVEKDPGIFGEGRTAVRAKLESFATTRIPASAFKSEDAWKGYLNRKHVQEKEKPLSALRRLGRKKALSGAPFPPQTKLPEKKKSALDGLRGLTQK